MNIVKQVGCYLVDSQNLAHRILAGKHTLFLNPADAKQFFNTVRQTAAHALNTDIAPYSGKPFVYKGFLVMPNSLLKRGTMQLPESTDEETRLLQQMIEELQTK